jgi:hypothetical protein
MIVCPVAVGPCGLHVVPSGTALKKTVPVFTGVIRPYVVAGIVP